jgi:hypothetical protein
MVSLLIVFLPSTWRWRQNYIDHVRHINQVHVQAGQWINVNLPKSALVAAFDIGAVKYFGQRKILDLGGLIDNEYTTHYLYKGRVLEFIEKVGATHLAMIETDDNLSGLAYRLGIYGNVATTKINLQQLKVYQIPSYIKPPFNRLPHYYFYPAYRKMVIYQIEWKGK